MRILVTGATGVIGSRVVPLLMAAGHDVTAAVRPQGGGAPGVPAGARVCPLDLFDPGQVRAAVAGHEVVINLATHIPASSARMLMPGAWRENDRIRRTGSANLVEAALAAGDHPVHPGVVRPHLRRAGRPLDRREQPGAPHQLQPFRARRRGGGNEVHRPGRQRRRAPLRRLLRPGRLAADRHDRLRPPGLDAAAGPGAKLLPLDLPRRCGGGGGQRAGGGAGDLQRHRRRAAAPPGVRRRPRRRAVAAAAPAAACLDGVPGRLGGPHDGPIAPPGQRQAAHRQQLEATLPQRPRGAASDGGGAARGRGSGRRPFDQHRPHRAAGGQQAI